MRVYRSSLIKRRRRTNPEIEDIKVAAYELIEADRPMTDRQGFYRLDRRSPRSSKANRSRSKT